MYPRTVYEMTKADHKALLDAMKSVPVMMIGGMSPRSQQENANDAWAALGKKMGFDYMTVQPASGKGELFFTAVPSENEVQRGERMAREAEEHKREEIKRLEAEVAEAQAKLAKILAE